jgi:hypothetical protein
MLGVTACRALCEKINKKNKNANVKPFMVKNHLWLFVNTQIENPAFDSQVQPAIPISHCSSHASWDPADAGCTEEPQVHDVDALAAQHKLQPPATCL